MEVHHCIHCGTESQPTWRFCRRCGTALEELDQQPAIANCSSCSSPVADGWRFCANCGSGTDSATPAATGLSEDDVADLIAAPRGAETAPAEAPAPAPEVPESEAGTAQPVVEPAPSPEPASVAEDAPAAQRPAEASPSIEPTEPDQTVPVVEATDAAQAAADHTISEPEVSFEPSASAPTGDESGWAAPRSETADVAPPPPPPDPLVDSGDIAAARAVAEAPPAPPAPPSGEPVAEVIEPADDPFAGSAEDADVIEVGEEVVATVADDSREPSITIPHRDEDREIRSAMPRPIGDDSPVPAEIPRPIGLDRDEPAAAADEDRPKRSVRVPERAPEPIGDGDDSDEAALPPLDGRFRNPGLLGQVVQLLLIVSAAFAVAMMVALIVLNNRLDDYATTGENLSRVLSAESMVNTWMRPLLIGIVVITYVLLTMWARRVLDNLAAFNNGMEETPLWMWMMPFANMWVLFRHLDLAWKGSDYYARGARTWQRSVPDVWTILFVLLPTLGFVLVLYAWVNGADTFSLAIDSNAFSLIGYFTIALGLLAGVRSIANIVDRQRTRVEGIS